MPQNTVLLISISFRNCFVEAMLMNGTLHKGMYNIIHAWYEHINQSYNIQADLIGMLLKMRYLDIVFITSIMFYLLT